MTPSVLRFATVTVCAAVAACDALPRLPFISPQPTMAAPAAATAKAPAQPEPAPRPRPAFEPGSARAPQLEMPEVDRQNLLVMSSEGLPGPERLLGMDRDGVTALLGPPAFTRRDDPARVWQYGTRSCLLDVFLYQEKDALRVAHVEVRSRSVIAVSEKECFLGLLTRRHPPGKG